MEIRADRMRDLTLWPALAVIILLSGAWFIYRPALSGTFLLDDIPNLSGLASVQDTSTALHFVLSGTSGPLGRPLALASFVPQASAWGRDAAPFLEVNVIIHLLNGLLVFLLSRQLAGTLGCRPRDSAFLACAVMAVWVLMPLLATSSLLIVQRMTTLSAGIVLAGLNLYVLARRQIDRRPGAALASMAATIVITTLLATLSKENGALFPVLLLVLESTLLIPPRTMPAMRWRVWSGIFLYLPTIMLVGYLFSLVPYADNVAARRGFTAVERLLNEGRILWEYLFNAFFAWSGHFGPFHDSRVAVGTALELATLVAATLWLVCLIGAVRWRRRYPVAAFAILWYLAGHMLESTTIPLELYFEHRNYLPILGPVFALCLAITSISGRYRLFARSLLAVYAAANAAILFSMTSLWARPLEAASLWAEEHPGSVRAATQLATQQLSQLGPEATFHTLQQFADQHPEHAYIRIPELNLSCLLAPGQDHSELIAYLQKTLPGVDFSVSAGNMLDQLLTTAATGQCTGLSPEVVGDLAAALMSNPLYDANPASRQFHCMLMARVARIQGDTDATLAYLSRAMDYGTSDNLDMMTVTTLVAAQRYGEARDFIAGAAERLPRQPIKRIAGTRNLEELSQYVDAAEQLDAAERNAGHDGPTEQ